MNERKAHVVGSGVGLRGGIAVPEARQAYQIKPFHSQTGLNTGALALPDVCLRG